MKKILTPGDQLLIWKAQVQSIGEFINTPMTFVVNCARLSEDCNEILRKFKTVAQLCQATVKELNKTNKKLVELLALMGCMPKPSQALSNHELAQMLVQLADQPLISEQAWYEYYLNQSLNGSYSEHFHKTNDIVYIYTKAGLISLLNINSLGYQALCSLWGGAVSAKQVVCYTSIVETEQKHLAYLFNISAQQVQQYL